MPHFPPLIDTRVLRPSETALKLGLVGEIELLRLKTIARWYARGLPPDVSWEDLLQEALTRILIGTRQVPDGVAPVAFIAGVMRSLRADHWRRIETAASAGREAAKRLPSRSQNLAEVADPAPGPERAVIAQQQLTAIHRLFAADHDASLILKGLEAGLTAEQIRLTTGMSETDYASARKRMRRVLLREGLTCEPR